MAIGYEGQVRVVDAGQSIGALVRAPHRGEATEFHGTAFAVGLREPIYMTATHCIPTELKNENGALAIVVAAEGASMTTPVIETEVIAGQEDITLLKTDYKSLAIVGLSPDVPRPWEEVMTAGYPEELVDTQPPGVRAAMRNLVGTVQRRLRPGGTVGVSGSAYEVSFPIPRGMSGSPVFVFGGRRDPGAPLAHGLVGVCLASHPSRLATWLEGDIFHDDLASEAGDDRPTRAYQVVEYGIVAALGDAHSATVAMTGGSLTDLVGLSPGRMWGADEQDPAGERG